MCHEPGLSQALRTCSTQDASSGSGLSLTSPRTAAPFEDAAGTYRQEGREPAPTIGCARAEIRKCPCRTRNTLVTVLDRSFEQPHSFEHPGLFVSTCL